MSLPNRSVNSDSSGERFRFVGGDFQPSLLGFPAQLLLDDFFRRLHLADPQRPLMLLIDAVDQLHDRDEKQA